MMKSSRKKKCICNKIEILKQITGTPKLLNCTEINQIRLNLLTERNSDGTGNLILRGKDIKERFKRRISDVDIRAICLYIRENRRRITKLDLSYNNVTDKGFLKLLKKLLIKGRSSLLHLNMMNNDLTVVSIENLIKYAKFFKLKYLRLNGNKLGTKGGQCLAEFLKINDSIEYCDIGETDQTLTSVAAIVAALRCDYGANKSVKMLDFSRIVPLFNRYPYETKWLAYHIELLLERNSTLTELHLQKNDLIGHDIEYLIRGLKKNTTLLYLDLSYNRVGEYGAELLGQYLYDRPQLILLNIAGNGIKDTGAKALSYGMPHSKIRALHIGNNKLTDEGILDLLNTIKKPYYIRFFNIWGNNIGHRSCVIIDRMLESGVLIQQNIDVKIFEVDEVFHAAYYPNPADKNKHLYYNELEFGCTQPIYHIKRNVLPERKKFKHDYNQR